jgi:hypothetical protein
MYVFMVQLTTLYVSKIVVIMAVNDGIIHEC